MGFFDDLKLPAGFEEDDYETPEWFSAPDDWMPGVVPVELVVARSDDAAICVTSISAYPAGFEFELLALCRKAPRRGVFNVLHTFDDEASEEALRFGLLYPDGRRASGTGGVFEGTVTHIGFTDEGDASPPDPDRALLLTPGGGRGGGNSATQSYWTWPLPPTGEVEFVCEWPAFGIGESRAMIAADQIHAAAERAQRIWAESAP